MRLLRLMAPAAFLLTTGCHSAYIDATVINRTDQTLSPVEVDYPSASFGTETLAQGQEFHYRFKLQGSGDLKLLYTDAGHVDHIIAGPHMNEGDEGRLTITIAPAGVTWTPSLKR